MQKRKLGNSNLEVSAIGLGCNGALSVRKFHFLEVSPSLPFPRKLLVDLTCLSLVNDKGRYHS